MNNKKVQIIVGSTRPGAIGPSIGKWFYDLSKKVETNLDFELINLADWNLPMYDEPVPPRAGNYQHQHTKDWSRKVSEADAYIFVTPEYNNGYPASLKNAIDYLYNEWTGKPAAILSYGFRYGKTAAVQLRQVLEKIGMKVIDDEINIQLKSDLYNEQGQLSNPVKSFEKYEGAVVKVLNELDK